MMSWGALVLVDKTFIHAANIAVALVLETPRCQCLCSLNYSQATKFQTQLHYYRSNHQLLVMSQFIHDVQSITAHNMLKVA